MAALAANERMPASAFHLAQIYYFKVHHSMCAGHMGRSKCRGSSLYDERSKENDHKMDDLPVFKHS
jgi:hypothetical protein